MLFETIRNKTHAHTHTKWWPISSDQNREHLAINLRSLSCASARARRKNKSDISENQSIYTVCWTPISNHDEFNFHATAIILFIVYPVHHFCWLSRSRDEQKQWAVKIDEIKWKSTSINCCACDIHTNKRKHNWNEKEEEKYFELEKKYQLIEKE